MRVLSVETLPSTETRPTTRWIASNAVVSPASAGGVAGVAGRGAWNVWIAASTGLAGLETVVSRRTGGGAVVPPRGGWAAAGVTRNSVPRRSAALCRGDHGR